MNTHVSFHSSFIKSIDSPMSLYGYLPHEYYYALSLADHYDLYPWDSMIHNIVKSSTSDRWWPDNVFISGGDPYLTSRFCGVVLGPTTISKMVSESLQDPLGHLLSGFRYRATHRLCPRTKPNSVDREGVC